MTLFILGLATEAFDYHSYFCTIALLILMVVIFNCNIAITLLFSEYNIKNDIFDNKN